MVAMASSPPAAPRQCPIIDCGQRDCKSTLENTEVGYDVKQYGEHWMGKGTILKLKYTQIQ